MKRTRILSAAAALGLAFAANTASAQGIYAGTHYLSWKVQSTGNPNVRADSRRVLAGYMMNDYLGFEVHAVTPGMSQPRGGVEAELDQLVSGFLRVNLPVFGDRANLFGLAGYTRGEVNIRAGDTASESSFEDSLSVGAGLEVAIVPDFLYVTADYVDYISRSTVGGDRKIQATATGLGLRVNF